jgi:8-oxo-dGTP pyrophosphatase MutT (NUDIX family)
MILPYDVNPFDGAVLDISAFPADIAGFTGSLKTTLEKIHEQSLQLGWLYLPAGRADLVPAAVRAGFTFHHADEHGLQLVYRVNPGAFMPGYATHFIGVGGVLIDDENRILVIQERHHTRRHFKLPGGALEPGEHLADAVVREVFEETGIRGEFLSLNCFRHWHGYRHGKSDIYFVCRLKPLNSDIIPDPAEVSEARWMPVNEYLNHPDTHPFNRRIVVTTLGTTGLKIDSIPGYGTPETHELMFSGF